jgi:hypothetical protein
VNLYTQSTDEQVSLRESKTSIRYSGMDTRKRMHNALTSGTVGKSSSETIRHVNIEQG